MLNYKSILFLIAIVLFVYYPILENDFLDFWDDQWVVMNSFTEGGISLNNVWSILTSYYHGQYAPFNEYLYLVLYSLFGYDSFIFHLASLVLHITNVCLVYIIFGKILIESGRLDPETARKVAFFTALIFAIHPFNVESVAWMSASKVLVYTFFYLLATYTYLEYLKKGSGCYYMYTVIFFICSFLGKEQAVTFPVWMLVINWLYGNSLRQTGVWRNVMPFWGLSLFFGIVTMLSQSHAGQGILTGEGGYPFWQRMVYACYTFTEYLLKCIVPYKLSYLYPFPSAAGEPLPSWLLIYPLLLVIIIVSFWKYLNRWPITFGLLFFLIHIGIVLHIIPLSRFAVVADRYVYVSSIGIAFLFAMGFYFIYKRYAKFKISVSALLICYLLALGIYSNKRTRVWYNTDTLKVELRELLKHRNYFNVKESMNNYIE